MTFDTATKLQIGHWLYRGVHEVRRLGLRSGDVVTCRRRGITWRLDLTQGIDLSIYLFGRFERAVQRLFESLLNPGMVVLDIGANVGAHALPMALSVAPTGRVYAVEATRWAHARLVRNMELNPGLRDVLVPVHGALVGPGETAPVERYASWSLNSASEPTVHPVHRGSPRATDGAMCTTLDRLVARFELDALDFIKLDVDGFETKVLQGGLNTLARFRPPILFELCNHVLLEHGTDAAELLDLMVRSGYAFVDERGRCFAPSESPKLIERIPARASIDVLAIPSE